MTAAGVNAPGRARIAEKTLRTDKWRRSPLITGSVLVFFIVYATVRIFMNKWYFVADDHYLTPIYSPCVNDSCVEGSSHLGRWFGTWPVFIPIALITFIVLAGFRGTCYYYRKAGYRSLFMAPAACAVPEPHKKYTGESKFPLVLLNLHRYFFYGAILFGLLNVWDGIQAFRGEDGGFGFGLGTVIIWVNLVMLWFYTLSCHACRHIVGGKLKHFSKHPLRYRYWNFVSKLNVNHGRYAMTSLVTVIVTDAYIMAVSAGWFADLRFVN
jgi:hypothetical protein